jgi:restriction endonuclease S subunit
MLTNKPYLQFVDLQDVNFWSVSFLKKHHHNFNKVFKSVKISEFLTQSKKIINIEDDILYKRLTVKINSNGVILRDQQLGKRIGTKKQYLSSSGQFILSKIDARNGAFGIIPSELDGAIVTNDFPVFDINEDIIIPHFFFLLTKTKAFIEFSKSCSSGSTNRQRIDLEKFLNFEVPLPSFEEQKKIVISYQEKIDEIDELKDFIIDIENKIEELFITALGLVREDKKQMTKGLNLIEYSTIDRWGLDFITSNKVLNNNYPTFKISDLCRISSGGTPSRNIKEYYINGTIPWIKTGELNDEILFDTEEKITEEALKNSSAKLYDVGSLVIAMYGATIGKTAKLGVASATNQACAVLFEIDNDIVLTDYLWEYLQSQKANLKVLAYGSAQPNLNAGIISNYKIPVPSIEKQEEIVIKMKSLKYDKSNLQSKINQKRREADKEFEETIFN